MLSQSMPAMNGAARKAAALLGAGLVVFVSLNAVAFAVPQKSKKPAASKPGSKTTTKPAGTASAKGGAVSVAEMIALGKKTYGANGCAGCHAIGGKGGNAGPDLSNVGANPAHTVKWLAEHVANPKAHTPTSAMPAFGTTIKGSAMTGLAVYLKSLGGKPEAGDVGAGSAGTPAAGGSGVTTIKVSPPDPLLVAKVEKAGGSVREIAQTDQRLEVDFHLKGATVNDAAIAPLATMKNVLELNLGKTGITDAGLAHIRGMKDLTDLHLEETKITDRGLVHLKGLTNLEYLNLYGTGVTDAGLANLTGLTKLKHIYLWQTKVTPAGVEALKKALPKVEVVMGWEEKK